MCRSYRYDGLYRVLEVSGLINDCDESLSLSNPVQNDYW